MKVSCPRSAMGSSARVHDLSALGNAAQHASLDVQVGAGHRPAPGASGRLGHGNSCSWQEVRQRIKLQPAWLVRRTRYIGSGATAPCQRIISIRPEETLTELS